jgi:hypothetical protein
MKSKVDRINVCQLEGCPMFIEFSRNDGSWRKYNNKAITDSTYCRIMDIIGGLVPNWELDYNGINLSFRVS